MTDEALFPGFEPPEAEPVEVLSAGQRLTRRQQQDVSNGKHPLTAGPLHPEATTRRHAPIPGHPDCHPDAPCSGRADPFTCGSCVFRDATYTYPKCLLPNPMTGRPWGTRVSHGATSDVRARWPACVDYVSVVDAPGHALNTDVRPAVCECGQSRYAGSPTFVKGRHAQHVRKELATER